MSTNKYKVGQIYRGKSAFPGLNHGYDFEVIAVNQFNGVKRTSYGEENSRQTWIDFEVADSMWQLVKDVETVNSAQYDKLKEAEEKYNTLVVQHELLQKSHRGMTIRVNELETENHDLKQQLWKQGERAAAQKPVAKPFIGNNRDDRNDACWAYVYAGICSADLASDELEKETPDYEDALKHTAEARIALERAEEHIEKLIKY